MKSVERHVPRYGPKGFRRSVQFDMDVIKTQEMLLRCIPIGSLRKRYFYLMEHSTQQSAHALARTIAEALRDRGHFIGEWDDF